MPKVQSKKRDTSEQIEFKDTMSEPIVMSMKKIEVVYAVNL